MDPIRGLKKGVRLAIGHAQNFGKVEAILSRKNQPIKLHCGSGGNYKDGWINIDYSPISKKDILHNLSKDIPFPDNSVDFIYTEHFIEHIPYEAALVFMVDAYRVLKPGGVLRISCPDLDFLVEAYNKDNWRTHSKEADRSEEWADVVDAHWYPNKSCMFNQAMREDGEHKHIYNFEDMAARLNEAGFFLHHIHQMKMNQSDYPELRDVDWRGDSLIVEAKKDRSFSPDHLLTVVVQAENDEATIAKTLDSILAQKTDFKFIIKVAEDLSRDGTRKILMNYQGKYPEAIRLIMSPKRVGAEKALYRVLKTVDTEYLAFVEGGDYWSDPDKLQTQVDALKKNPACTVSAHNTLMDDAAHNKKYNFVTTEKIKSQYGAQDNFDVHPSSLVCRNVFSFASLPFYMAQDKNLRSLYLAEGDLYYTDKIMSTHSVTPQKVFSKQYLRKALFSTLSSYSLKKKH